MKMPPAILFFASLFFIFAACAQKTYFVSVTGNDKNEGDIYRPFATWEYINILVKDGRLQAGDTVYIRGGIYRSCYSNSEENHVLWKNIHGNQDKRIAIMAYPGEVPILALDDIITTHPNPTGLRIENCSYIHIKGIRITGLGQVADGTGLSRGLDISHTSNSLFEQIEIDHIGGYGLMLGNKAVNSMFLNIDVHHIYDSLTVKDKWNNANGIQCTGGSTADRDTFRYCRVWKCSDDGFDFYRSDGSFVFEGCWAFWNGYKPFTWEAAGDGSGFKLGPHNGYPAKISKTVSKAQRKLIHCLAFENRQVGFNQNNGGFNYTLHNNTSFHNGSDTFGYGFMWDFIHPAVKQDFKNNISFKDFRPVRGAEIKGHNNSWNLKHTICSDDFMSISSEGVDGLRRADGSLPALTFLRLREASALLKTLGAKNPVDPGAQGLDSAQ